MSGAAAHTRVARRPLRLGDRGAGAGPASQNAATAAAAGAAPRTSKPRIPMSISLMAPISAAIISPRCGSEPTRAAERSRRHDAARRTLRGGLGVGRDDKKAAEWYKLAAEHGDREAMFALAMFNFDGRAGPRNETEGARLLAGRQARPSGAQLRSRPALSAGQAFPQDFKRAAELFRAAADAGNSEAQYALATMYKEGRGVPKD